MKAVRLHQRGGPEQIVVEEAPLPASQVASRWRLRRLSHLRQQFTTAVRNRDNDVELPVIP